MSSVSGRPSETCVRKAHLGSRAICAVWLTTMAACAPAAAAPGGAHGDVVCKPARPARAGVVLLHGGGFWIGATRQYLREFCAPWAAAGFRAVGVDYPVRNFVGAIRASRRAARSLRGVVAPVVAFGESAGGTLALRLGLAGHVGAVAAIAAPTDLISWNRDDPTFWTQVMGMSIADRRRASPIFRVGAWCPPTLLLHSPTDEVVPFHQSVALAHRLATATLRPLRGPHLADPSARVRALRWLSTRVARRNRSAAC